MQETKETKFWVTVIWVVVMQMNPHRVQGAFSYLPWSGQTIIPAQKSKHGSNLNQLLLFTIKNISNMFNCQQAQK